MQKPTLDNRGIRMRIGLFTDQFSVGISGQTTSVMLLYNYFKHNGHTCYIFTSHTKKLVDDNPDIINLPGIPYPMKNMKEYRFSLFVKRHMKLIESCKLDIIHVHTEHYLANVALAAKKKLGVPVVYTLHTMWEYYLDYLSKPIYAIRDEVIEELVEDGKNGFLCDSEAELTKRMEQLCDTKEAPSQFEPLEGYSVQDYARNIFALYEKVIKNAKKEAVKK